jgi:uncharacterized membrane protein
LVVEIGLITLAITLNPFYNVLILQVIWAIGGSMILMGILVRLRAPLFFIGIVGAVIFFAHNLIDNVNFGHVAHTLWWRLLLSSNGFGAFYTTGTGRGILMAYALLPWTGVMMLGYVFGMVYKRSFNAIKRKKVLMSSGLALLGLFLMFRYFNI